MIFAREIISGYTGRWSFAYLKTSSNKALVLGAFLFFNASYCYSQIDEAMDNARTRNKVKTQTTLRRNYKGTVPVGQEYRADYAEFNSRGKKTLEKTFDETPQLIKQYQAIYNDSNRVVKEIWKAEYTDSAVYKCDVHNRLVEERWYWQEDNTRSRINHFYDDSSRLVCTITQNGLGKLVDSLFYLDNRLALTRSYNEYGQLSSNTTNIYDKQGRLVEEIKTNVDGQMLQKITHVYYDAGLLKSLQVSYYSPDAKEDNSNEIAYSQTTDTYKYINELPSEQTTVSINDKEKVVDTQSSYTFDEKGLLTELVMTNLLTHEKSVFKYNYTY